MIAFSVGRNREDIHYDYKSEKQYLAAILCPKTFRWGIFFLVFGFLLSILDTFILKLAIGSP